MRNNNVRRTPWSARDALVPQKPTRGSAADQGVRPTLLVLAAALMISGCGSAPKPEAKARQIAWRPLESWSGQGNMQTESFNIESTQWRIKWETKAASPGAGTFTVVVHSAVSGRPIMAAVDHRGAGQGTAYVTEDPRLYHLVIEAADVDWSVSVDEAVSRDAP